MTGLVIPVQGSPPGAACFQVFASAPLTAGQEATIFYGPHTSLELLISCGFVPGANPADRVPLYHSLQVHPPCHWLVCPSFGDCFEATRTPPDFLKLDELARDRVWGGGPYQVKEGRESGSGFTRLQFRSENLGLTLLKVLSPGNLTSTSRSYKPSRQLGQT